jgi:phosphodiesterase/alkaline phosphatase D-like protein
LGEQQWEWFKTALSRSDASVNLVVTSLQVHAKHFYAASKIENWSGFQTAHHRLDQALLQQQNTPTIVISGDVHHAQLLRKDCPQQQHRQQQQQHDSDTTTNTTSTILCRIHPLYEVMTSGMTHD